MAKKKILILSVDYDDDLYEKARIKAPLIGREDNLKAAQELAIADPQDSDANTMFQAIKTYDEINKQQDTTAEVATITGHKKLGFRADTELSNQLEAVIRETNPDSCIFVGDGASDEQILPLIQSRIKIDGVQTVTIKQAKELEKTYFVILEKLKDPHYARLILGIPGLLLVSFFLFNLTGLRYALGLIGIYLILKGFGIEDIVVDYIKSSLNLKKIRSIFTLAALPIFAIGLWLGISTFLNALNELPTYSALGQGINQSITLIAIGILTILVGGIIDAFKDARKILIFDYANRITITILIWLFLSALGGWLVGKTSFEILLNELFLTIFIITCATFLFANLKQNSFKEFKLVGKDIFNKYGHYLGKITQQKKDEVEVKNTSGKHLKIAFDKLDFEGTLIVAKI